MDKETGPPLETVLRDLKLTEDDLDFGFTHADARHIWWQIFGPKEDGL